MLIFLDTETTGVGRDARLVQLAYKVPKEIEVCDYFKPPVPIEIGAMAIHHITNEKVEKLCSFESCSRKPQLQKLLKDLVLVAHNANFDMGILRTEGVETGTYIDTLQIARHLFQEFECHTLQYLRYYFEVNIEADAHDAMGDVIILEHVFHHLAGAVAEKFGIDDEIEIYKKMIALSRDPIIYKKFSFGKHKGKDFSAVKLTDAAYLRWLLRSESSKPEDEQNINIIATLKYYL